jgi:hypothetical protein
MRSQIKHTRNPILTVLALALAAANVANASFSPVAINPASFNHDVIVEATAPAPINSVVNVSLDGGTNKSGATWYERGYTTNAAWGIPPAGSLVTNKTDPNQYFQMPPDYHVNNVIMVGHHNGGRTPVFPTNTFTLTAPATFTALSFLTSAGNGPVTVGYTIHYSDASTEAGQFTALDWFFGSTNWAYNPFGRVNVGGGLANVTVTTGPNVNAIAGIWATNVPVGSAVNITSIDFYYVGSGGNNNTNNNGRAAILAVSGSTDNVNYSPIAVTGYAYDAVVEADGPQTLGTGIGTVLSNYVTASMDGGTTKANSGWYEKGYYATFPNSGLPTAGSTINSATLPASYTMPSSYAGNCAVMVASNVPTASVSFASPAAYGAISFLCAAAGGDTFCPSVIQFQDGTTQTNVLFVPDWSNRDVPQAYIGFGRVSPTGRGVNNTPDQFVSPFATPLPNFEFRGLGLPIGRLYDSVITVTNTSSAITNVTVTFTNGISTRVATIFAVSGAPNGSVPPVLGYRGTPTFGQPANARIADRTFVKVWEGTNNLVLSVTNIAGSSPITYQWKKAPRGGGFSDIFYSIDYSSFANVTDGGRVSGATSSRLVISNALTSDSSDYLVVATSPGGSITSLVATAMILTTNQSLLVGAPLGDIVSSYTGETIANPAEGPDHVVDRVSQKWLSGGFMPGTVLPFVGPVGIIVTPVSGSSIVSSMRFYAANDATGRDPFDYALEGSNDGSTWSPITGGVLKGSLGLPTGRNGGGSTPLDPLNQNIIEVDFANAAGYKSYRFTITNNINRSGDTLMQIAEVELLGTLVPNPPVWVRQPDPAATVYVGASPSFTVSATGYPVPRYQWYKGASLIPNATNSTYTFPNAQLSDAGSTFSCVASNVFGTTNSTSLTLSVIAAPVQSYPAAVVANGPIGYWRLNEGPDDGSGNNGLAARDYVGGRNGYYSNALIAVSGYNPASDPDTAASFGSVNNSFVAEIKDVDFSRATNAVSGGRFTVEAWVKGGNQTVNAAVVSKGYNGALNAGTGTGTEQFVLDVAGADPRKYRFLVRDAAGNGRVAQSTVVPYDPIALQETWRHVVGVCDQPNGKVYLYVDGLLAGSGDIPVAGGILSQPLPMTIGSRKSSGASEYDNQWVGVIDDVALYNTALSAGQVLAHYYAAQRPPLITLQPTNNTTPENVTVTFYSAAYGPGTLGYQWYLSDGSNPTTPVVGQTSPNLVFTTAAAQSGNNYQLVVTNDFGAVTSVVAQLTVVGGVPSYFVNLPSSATYLVGHVIQLQVEAAGTAPFTYQWSKDNVPLADNYRISGSQTNTLVIGYATNTDSGNYQVVVSNGQGNTPSTVVALTVTNADSSATPFNPSGTGWTLQGTTAPVMGANRLEVSSGLGSTARSAFMNTKQAISAFNASFVYQTASGAGGADGATFCIQNDSDGAAAVGTAGGGLGYASITPSVALAFNIWDPNTRGIRLLQGGTVTTPFFPITPVLVGANTNPIQVNLMYYLGVLSSTFKDLVTSATFTTNQVVDIPAAVGDSTAYVGFTGADGGTASTQVISNFTMFPPPVAMKVQMTNNTLVLSWPASTGAFLKSTPSLTSPVWTYVTDTFRVVGSEARVTVSPGTGNRFYRLDVYP